MCLNVTHASLVDEGVNLTDFFERCKPLFKEEGFAITYLTKDEYFADSKYEWLEIAKIVEKKCPDEDDFKVKYREYCDDFKYYREKKKCAGLDWDKFIIGKNEDPQKYRSEDYYSSECFEIALTKQDIAIQDECMLLYGVIVSSITQKKGLCVCGPQNRCQGKCTLIQSLIQKSGNQDFLLEASRYYEEIKQKFEWEEEFNQWRNQNTSKDAIEQALIPPAQLNSPDASMPKSLNHAITPLVGSVQKENLWDSFKETIREGWNIFVKSISVIILYFQTLLGIGKIAACITISVIFLIFMFLGLFIYNRIRNKNKRFEGLV